MNILDDDRPPYVFGLDRARYETPEGTPLAVTITLIQITEGTGRPDVQGAFVITVDPPSFKPIPFGVAGEKGAATRSSSSLERRPLRPAVAG